MTYKRHWYFCHFLKRLIWYKIYSRRFNNKVVRGPKVCIVLYEKIIGSLFQAIYEVVKVKLKKNGLVIPAFTHILRIHDLSSYPSRWLILYPFFCVHFTDHIETKRMDGISHHFGIWHSTPPIYLSIPVNRILIFIFKTLTENVDAPLFHDNNSKRKLQGHGYKIRIYMYPVQIPNV